MNAAIFDYFFFFRWTLSYYDLVADFSLDIWHTLICVYIDFIYFTLQLVFPLVIIIWALLIQSLDN
jgi:hypothetical protein